MDWKHFSQLIVTILVAAVGWWAVHYFTAERDLINARRQQQVTYLIEAYRRLEGGSNRRDNFDPYRQQVEAALSDVQLFGARTQVSLANRFARDIRDTGSGSLDTLLEDLRKSLRTELNLEQVDEKPLHVRFVGEHHVPGPTENNQHEKKY